MDPLLIDNAIRRVADERIRAAMADGQFDQLPGYGQPIAGLDEAFDENWWVRNWLARQNVNRANLRQELNEMRKRQAR